MSGRWHTVIRGAKLREYLAERDPGLAARLDPEGTNVMVVGRPIDGGRAIRAALLLKLRSQTKPELRTLDFPLEAWNRVSDRMWDEGPGARPN